MTGWNPEEWVRNRASERAKGKEMAYAEGFRVITLVSDEDWKKTRGEVLPTNTKESD
jgi:hypothetical protein